ncbi:MAG: hypothetical protein WC877_00460 [Dehalococcoidales bacterium]|jgi:hypothetical protein
MIIEIKANTKTRQNTWAIFYDDRKKASIHISDYVPDLSDYKFKQNFKLYKDNQLMFVGKSDEVSFKPLEEFGKPFKCNRIDFYSKNREDYITLTEEFL